MSEIKESNFEKGQNLAYNELGKFLTTFEHTVHSFRDSIAEILKQNGLQEQIYSDILLSKQTADPILTAFQSMTYYYFENSQQKIIHSIINETRQLIEVRNIIIHSFWAIGVGVDDYNEVSIIGIKQKTSKQGITNYNLDLELSDLREINKLAYDLSIICYELSKKLKKELESRRIGHKN